MLDVKVAYHRHSSKPRSFAWVALWVVRSRCGCIFRCGFCSPYFASLESSRGPPEFPYNPKSGEEMPCTQYAHWHFHIAPLPEADIDTGETKRRPRNNMSTAECQAQVT